jgi:hypothetical protein
MLKNILKLEGAQKLTKNEQKSISGGLAGCHMYFFEYCTTTQGACTDPKYISYCKPCCELA